MKRGLRLAPAALALAGLYSACSLAGDITPPPALATAQAAVPAPTSLPLTEPELPSSPANLAAGEPLFADRCAACHGPAGMGDGELAGELTFPPAALADPERARAASPETWYQIVTNGKLDRLMPPFSSLSDQQRWDVVGYALSLSTTREELQAGQALFEQHCAECHSQPAFESAYLRSAPRSHIYQVIRDGRGAEMPAFDAQLEDERLWALAGYVQSLGWNTSPPPEQTVDRPATSESVVVGQIIHGTAGAEIPTDLQVRILGFDGEQQVLDEFVPVDRQGGFQLEPIEIAPGRLFFATLEYQQVQYRSELAHAPTDGSPLELPLTIYETTTDSTPLRVERLHLLIDFPQAGVMRVLQLWVVGNLSDRVVAPGLRVSLPASAFNLSFEEGQLGEHFEETAAGFTDHEPVPPGSSIDQLVFAFELAREGSLGYRQPMQHPVEAVTILVPADGPRLSGLIDEGVRDLGGLQMHSYAAAALEPGDSLSFRVARPSGIAGPVVAAVAGAAALVIALFLVFRSRSATSRAAAPEQSPREVLDQQALLRGIALLDAEYEAGQLDQADWEQRRESLKQQALDLMRGSGG